MNATNEKNRYVISLQTPGFLLAMILVAQASRGAEEFEKFDQPKTQYVIADSADTLAGPSDSTYRTGALKRGDTVEVYGRLGADWSAVRPPAGQFDWIVAQHAHLLPGGKIAEVIDVATPAWIHTDDESRDQFQWQVKLQPSQQVNVLEQVQQKLADGKSRAWYRIDPPPGEFRWLRADALSDQPPKFRALQVVAKENNANELSATPIAATLQHDVSAVEQASGKIIQMSTEPVVLAPGEYVVDSDESFAQTDAPEMLMEGGWEQHSMMVDEAGNFIEPMLHDGLVSSESCETCGPDFNDPKRRLMPVSRFLGLLGFALVEAERPLDASVCHECGVAGCTTCGSSLAAHRAAAIGSLPSRLDSLPRPSPHLSSDTVDRSLLIDRLGKARENLREGLGDIRENLSSTVPLSATKSPPTDSASVSLGSPVGSGQQSLLKETDIWQGLPWNGVQSSDLQLEVQSPTSSLEWAQRPSNLSNEPTLAAPAPGGTLIRTSTPQSTDQSNFTPTISPPNDVRYTSRLLQQAAAELTAIVASPTEQWKLQPLRQQVSLWVENGADPVARGEARLLLDRIDQLEEFRSKWLRANSNSIAVATPALAKPNYAGDQSTNVSQVSFQRPQNQAQPQSGSSQFNFTAAKAIIDAADASGWLVAVHGQRDDFPKFALTDDAGHLVAYVEAPPGSNLRVYLQQPVAIHGQRGMHAVLNMRTILAERVVRIADAR